MAKYEVQKVWIIGGLVAATLVTAFEAVKPRGADILGALLYKCFGDITPALPLIFTIVSAAFIAIAFKYNVFKLFFFFPAITLCDMLIAFFAYRSRNVAVETLYLHLTAPVVLWSIYAACKYFERPVDRPRREEKKNPTKPLISSDGNKKISTAFELYGIDARISRIIDGAATKRFIVALNGATKISDIRNRLEDISLKLGVNPQSVSIGTDCGVVYIDILKPPKERRTENLNSVQKALRLPTTIPIGSTPSGERVLRELEEFPHLLVGGGSGSGKSVFLSAAIFSLLIRNSPDKLNLLLLDGKSDLCVFENAPHLIADIAYEPEEVFKALAVAKAELRRRIQTKRRDRHAVFPILLIVIDEIDSLLKPHKKEIEDVLTPLSKMGRSLNIHMIIGSQRPSGDLISPHILTNFMSRVCLKVAKPAYSENFIGIPDGAKLAGKGDMLYQEKEGTQRLQGYFVSMDDIENVIAKLPYKAIDRIKFSALESAPEIETEPETPSGNLIRLPENRSQPRSQPAGSFMNGCAVHAPENQDMNVHERSSVNEMNGKKTDTDTSAVHERERERKRERAKELKSGGHSLAEIANELSISKTLVYNLVNDK